MPYDTFGFGTAYSGDTKYWTCDPDDIDDFNSNYGTVALYYYDQTGSANWVATFKIMTWLADISWTTTNGYRHPEATAEVAITAGDYYSTYASKCYIKFGSSTISGANTSSTYLTSYKTLSSLGSGGTVAYGYSSVGHRASGDGSITYTSSTTVYASRNSSGSNSVTKSVSSGSYVVTYKEDVFTASFNSDGGSPSSYSSQSVYWGSTASSPGSPSKGDVSRSITLTFNPGSGAAQTSATASESVTDSYGFNEWYCNGYSISSYSVESDCTFTASYSVSSYGTAYLTIPSFGTTGTPTKTGYSFEGWYYGNSYVGKDSGQQTEIAFGSDGGTSYSISAKWSELSYPFTVKCVRKVGDEYIEIDGQQINSFNLAYTGSIKFGTGQLTVPSITGYTSPTTMLCAADPSIKLSEISTKSSSYTNDYLSGSMGLNTAYNLTTWYMVYELITDTYTLKLNGGTINGSGDDITGTYDITTPTFNLRDYSPEKDNTTFIGWLYNNKYYSEIDPTNPEIQTSWPMNRTYTADYMPIGNFVFADDKRWHPVSNMWYWNGTKWEGGKPDETIPSSIITTRVIRWVYLSDGKWHMDYGHQDVSLD